LAEPKTTLWPLDPHTRGKHEVLKRYLDAWFPVLGSWNGRILFIDGFAGPGEYQGGEPGSPIIALGALSNHNAKHVISAEVGFIFIERDEARANHLRKVCDRLQPTLPPKCWVNVVNRAFDDEISGVLNNLDEQSKKLAPSFVMVDPFGVSGIPMAVLSRVLRNPRCEIYVSFMYESINRFMNQAEFAPHLDALYGCEKWRDGASIANAQDRKRFMYDLYRSQLKRAGAGHVVHFDLYERNRLVYAIFFATASLKGCDLMKKAIWKVAPFGNYAFHGSHSTQLTLGLLSTDFSSLRKFIAQRVKGKGWVLVEELSDAVASDECDYHTSHLRSGALVPMEKEGLLEVDPSTRSRRFTFPDGTRVRIMATTRKMN
jgi:three-Cys-motif partner protein